MLMETDTYRQILPPDERYCIPSLNEIRFIGHRQTMSLVLGSCVSTVFVGGAGPFIIAANHIVIANPRGRSIVALKSAREQVDEIMGVYENAFGIGRDEICCLHLIGAGSKPMKEPFTVPEENIREATRIIAERNFGLMFRDTGSFFLATYSLYRSNLAVFIENTFTREHISFTIDLLQMKKNMSRGAGLLPASSLSPRDPGFEFLAADGVITFITGDRNRGFAI
jgi:hypothetical protein